MEKAILKTLIYSDIFDYPLKGYEIHKWLIGRVASFQQIEKSLTKLLIKGKVIKVKDYYVLAKRKGIVTKRQLREKQSKKFLLKGKICCTFLKIIPTLKLVGISGGLALNNTDKKDDIDLFLITSKNRLWLTRLLVIFILDLVGVRRKAGMNSKQVSGKICVNILIEETFLEQEKKDLYIAHEVLQMKVLWQRGNTYKKYLEKNSWAFEFLPSWIGDEISDSTVFLNWAPPILGKVLENLAKRFQLKIMKKPQGAERIEDGSLYFHPNDTRQEVISLYKQKVKSLSST